MGYINATQKGSFVPFASLRASYCLPLQALVCSIVPWDNISHRIYACHVFPRPWARHYRVSVPQFAHLDNRHAEDISMQAALGGMPIPVAVFTIRHAASLLLHGLTDAFVRQGSVMRILSPRIIGYLYKTCALCLTCLRKCKTACRRPKRESQGVTPRRRLAAARRESHKG